MSQPSPSPVAVAAAVRFSFRALLLVWAGFWAWFVVAVSLGEKPAPPAWIPAAWLGGLAILVAAAWLRPLLGGVLLLLGGCWLAYAFPKSWALLAAPAVFLGLAALALERAGFAKRA